MPLDSAKQFGPVVPLVFTASGWFPLGFVGWLRWGWRPLPLAATGRMKGQPVNRFEDEWAVRRTLERYCRFVDDCDFGRLVELFTVDAAVDLGGTHLQGRDAIAAHYAKVNPHAHPTGIHFVVNCIIDFDGDTEASAESDFLQVWRIGEGGGGDAASVIGGAYLSEIPISGRYIDRLRRNDAGEWLLVERSVMFFDTSPYRTTTLS